MKYVLEGRTRAFAVAVLRFVQSLPDQPHGRVIAWQLAKAGGSVGANYRRAKRAQSDRDFVAKLKVVEEEADESSFWLDACVELGVGNGPEAIRLKREASEIAAMTVAAIKTMRQRGTGTN